MTRADLPTRAEVARALLSERFKARHAADARARLAAAVETFNAAEHPDPVARLLAHHELDRLRVALAIAEGRAPPYPLRRYMTQQKPPSET